MTDDETRTDTQPSRPTWLVVLTIVAMWVVLAGLIGVLARQSGWTLGWVYVALHVVGDNIQKVSLLIWNPELLRRRVKLFGTGTKSWDKVFLVMILTILITILVVGVRDFDTRFGDPGEPGSVWLIGLAIYASGWCLFTWCSLVNPHFEASVRIQSDRGHRVMDSGPYATIRHPGYVGFGAVFLSTPLLLSSPLILLLSLIAVLGFVIRTVLEDRTLQTELPGYAEYATRVRFRLIPGVW